jgi:orotate phosphoribosyltransferase
MDIKKIYEENGALLKGHFKLSSGAYSKEYLQSAKLLENPKLSESLIKELAQRIKKHGLIIDTVCSPAIGGLLAGYELARALGVRFIFTERVDGKMELRRGFDVSSGEKIFICEDVITTGGSAMEASACISDRGGKTVGFGALANRGFCKRVDGISINKPECKLQDDLPLFALEDFDFKMYSASECDFTDIAVKPGSRTKS